MSEISKLEQNLIIKKIKIVSSNRNTLFGEINLNLSKTNYAA